MQTEAGVKSYRTVKGESRTEQVIKRSRFIGSCFPIQSEAEALAHIERLRKENWDASHNCYAYSIGARGECARFSDDGEPGGTAGMPMMETIKNIGVTNVLCVVTRYFGGILLGAGGLVRAYSGSCAQAVKAAGLIDMRPCVAFGFRIAYPQWSLLQSIIAKFGSIEDTIYSEIVECKAWISKEETEGFLAELTNRSDGRITAERLEEKLFPFDAEV